MRPPDLLHLAVAVGADNAFAGTSFHPQDGDTHHFVVGDVLLSKPVVLDVRIVGINTNELNEPGGPEAAAALAGLLPFGAVVTLRHLHPDKYDGRTLAQVTTGLGVDIAAWMIAQGLAVPWNGVGAKPKVPWPPPEPTP